MNIRLQTTRLQTTGAYSVNMDATLFDSIVNTILENAAQQSATEMDIRLDGEENTINIYFQDNGPGVSAANALRIFEPFFTTRPNQGGTGLGLAVAKRLAIAHGGDLFLQDNPQHEGDIQHGYSSKGAVFCLHLPLAVL